MVYRSKIDSVEQKDGKTKLLTNYAKYNSIDEKWISLEDLFEKNTDFLDLLFVKFRGEAPEEKEKKLLLKTLLIVCSGVGYHPPSIFVPKTIASTTKDRRFAIINGLIGGLCTMGTHHLGAVYDVMVDLQYIKKEAESKDIEDVIDEYAGSRLNNGNKIIGFGHPVYNEDPRPKLLYQNIKNTYIKNAYINVYDSLAKKLLDKKDLKPNIDGALALSYLSLGFEPEQGLYLSFLARSLNMTCHILEELPEKPFSFFVKATDAQIQKQP